MKSGGSSKKGSKFERDTLSKLSLWVSVGTRKDLFRRSIMSGGRATIALKDGTTEFVNQAGDASLADPTHVLASKFLDVFLTEFKHYKVIHYESLIFGVPKDNSIYAFWLRLVNDSKNFSKLPFLVARQNYKKDIVMLNKAGVHLLNLKRYRIASYDRLGTHLFYLDDVLGINPVNMTLNGSM